jgi:sn-glycerol 3-phosphate transport system ATP-binding protein
MNALRLGSAGGVGVVCGTEGPPVLSRGGDGIVLGIRPEAVRLASSGVPAVVESVEFLGADSLVACEAGTERLVARVLGRVTAPPGTQVHLAWRAEDVHLFDEAEGTRRDDLAVHAIGAGEKLGVAV